MLQNITNKITQRIRLVSSSQMIIAGFAAVILLGSLLLMLPFATRDGQGAGFPEALFTATSAVCVTGLIVQDTATYWTAFGQTVILILIQIGGMGVVTVAVAIAAVSGRQMSLKQRSTMQEAISAHQVGGIVQMTGFIIRTVFFAELLGALLMLPVFGREFGLGKGIAYALFHSVSAFCNAGFDLMGIRSPYSSLTLLADSPLINLTIMGLIIFGGIGFLTWNDMAKHRHHLKRYSMQSKVILITTAALILLPTVLFFFTEFTEGSPGSRLLYSLFQAVTPRTAGFNTADLTRMSDSGQAIIILLMLIGGAPGSTAGGMKVTTFAVILSTSIAVFRRQEHTHFFGRRIPDENIRTASTILAMYLLLFFLGGLIISRVEGLPLQTCLFETASAVGTVGLTLGITPGLGLLSRLILILLMYIGRVGGLTLIFSAVHSSQKGNSRLPLEKLTVG